MNDASRAVLALTNTLVDVGVSPLKARELWHLLDGVDDPAALLGRSATELAALVGGAADVDRLAALLDSGVSLAVRLDALHDQGIWALTPYDPDYPTALRGRLGPAAPPVLYGAGSPAVLSADGIGIIGAPGAEEADGDTAAVARAAAAAVVAGGRAVTVAGIGEVTDGGGDGRAAGALGVLAGGLDRALARADERRAVLAGRLCLCSPFRPDARATERGAIGRNRTVHGLSPVTLVVAADDGHGAAWTAATEALARGFGTVSVWRGDGEGSGNETLERTGATPVTDVAQLLAMGHD